MMLKIFFAGAFWCFFISIVLPVRGVAQNKGAKDSLARIEFQEAIRMEFENNYSNKIKSFLEKNPDRFNKMKSELEAIEKQNDTTLKKQAQDKYLNDHKQEYLKAIAGAGVSIQAVMAKLKNKYPNYEFSSPDGISMIITNVSPQAQSKGGSAARIPLPAEEEADGKTAGPHSLAYSLPTDYPIVFQFSKSENCASVSGSSVTFSTTPRRVNTYSSAALIGKCYAQGWMEHQSVLPSNVPGIYLGYYGNIYLEGAAYAVGGYSYVYSSSQYYIWSPGSVNPNIYTSPSYELTIVAPILWVTSKKVNYVITNNFNLSSYKGQKLMWYNSAYTSSSSSFISKSYGLSYLNYYQANLNY